MQTKPTYEDLQKEIQILQEKLAHKAEKSLEKDETRHRFFSKISDEAIFLIDKGICIDANEKACKLSGYSYEELIGKPGTESISNEYKELVKKNIISGYELPYDVVAVRKDGSKFQAEIHGKNFNHNGKDIRITIIRDITKRKKAEEALRKSETKFKGLYNGMSAGVIFCKAIYNNKGKMTNCIYKDMNPIYEQLTNLKKETAIGNTVLDMMPQTEPEWFTQFEKVVKTGKSISFEMYHEQTKKHYYVFAYNSQKDEFVAIFEDITIRKKAKKELKESKDRLKTFSNLTNEAIFFSKNGICFDANKRASELFGYSTKELIGIYGTDIIAPESKKLVLKNILSGYDKQYDIVAQKKDGTKFHAEIHSKMFKYNDDDIRVAVVRDISDRKKAEEKLKESITEYTNLNKKYLVQNKELLRTNENVEKREKHLEINQIHYQFINRLNKDLTKGENISKLIQEICDHFKKIHFLNVTDLYLLHTNEEQNKYIQVEYSNIENNLIKLSENLTGLSYKDFKIHLFEGSIYNELYTTKKPIELTGKETIIAIKDFTSPNKKILRKFAPAIAKLMDLNNLYMVPIIINNEAIGHIGFNSKFKLDDFTKTTFQMMITEIGNLIKRNRINQEILYAKQKLEKSKSELTESNKTKDQFFSIIAHDLRNPFNAMAGFSELLLENFDKFNNQKKKKFLRYIYESIQNADKLLGNLLLWSRSQQNRIDFKPEKINLDSIVEESITILKHTASNKNLTIINKIEKKSFVNADKNMLLTIFRNLISNAIKFTEVGGEISLLSNIISDKNKHKQIQITVKDNGVGIAKENRDKLFDLNTKTTSAGTEKEKGTGLGLVLCKEFIIKHGGKIWFESEINKGSDFHFTIPL